MKPKFSHTIIYVENVQETLSFFEKAFGLSQRFLDDSGLYGELETGQTSLAFAARSFIKENLGDVYAQEKPAGFEVCLIQEDIMSLLEQAISAGATLISPPTKMPWGQTIAYVKTPQDILVEFGTPLS